MFCYENLHTFCFKHEKYASFNILKIALLYKYNQSPLALALRATSFTLHLIFKLK